MVSEGKEKKRKAATTSSTTDPDHKKSKKSKLAPDKDTTDRETEPSVSAEQTALIPPVNGAAATRKSKTKAPKRAADFLSESEDVAPSKDVKSSGAVVTPDEIISKAKVKKLKNTADKATIEASTGIESGPTEVAAVIPAAAPQKDQDEFIAAEPLKKDKKKKKARVVEKDASASATQDSTSKPAKKRGPTAVETAAEKFNRLITTPVNAWPGKDKKSKQVKKAETPGDATTFTADGTNGVHGNANDENLETVADKSAPLSSMQAEAQATTEKELEDEWESEDENEDQGQALLAGFDSDGEDTAVDTGLLEDSSTLPIPNHKKTTKKLTKAAKSGNKDGPGAVYVGRIPHGFYEHQMRDYFSQFGTITKLRLSRNRVTGASKHFAFIEFESDEVAKIVAETMDNYLMFGHILKCKYAPQESLHPDVWKGANKRFKKVPYNKLEKKALEAPKTKEKWNAKIQKEQKKREAKAETLKKIGYEMELPKMTAPEEVLQRRKLESSEEQKGIEELPEVEGMPEVEIPAVAPTVDVLITEVPKDEIALKKADEAEKSKKSKKSKTVVAEAAAAAVDEPEATPVASADVAEVAEPSQPMKGKREKSKKSKKSKKVVTEPAAAAVEEPEAAPIASANAADLVEPSQLQKEKRDKRKEKREKSKATKEDQLSSESKGDGNAAVVKTVVETAIVPADADTIMEEAVPLSDPSAAAVEAATEKGKRPKKGKKSSKTGEIPTGATANGEAAPDVAATTTITTTVIPAAVQAPSTSTKTEKKPKASKGKDKKEKRTYSSIDTSAQPEQRQQQLKSILKKTPQKA